MEGNWVMTGRMRNEMAERYLRGKEGWRGLHKDGSKRGGRLKEGGSAMVYFLEFMRRTDVVKTFDYSITVIWFEDGKISIPRIWICLRSTTNCSDVLVQDKDDNIEVS